MKEYKVKRYGRDRRHQKTAATLKTVLMVLLIAGACCAGWFLYDPISAWLTEKAEEHQQRQEQQRQEERAVHPAGVGVVERGVDLVKQTEGAGLIKKKG